MPPLVFGLYERLITRALKAELDALERQGAAVARVAPLDPAEAHARLARHVEGIVAHALRDVHDSDRRARQADISPVLFHWESQSGTTQESPTGRRYIRHRDLGGHILLFVRPRRRQDGRALPYTLLGPADIVSFKGERPISFVWRLRRPMPAGMFREARVATG